MLGLIIELSASWILLWIYEKSNLLSLGIQPTQRRMLDLAFGFITSSLLCTISLSFIIMLSKTTVAYNPAFTTTLFLSSSFWMLKSVLFEELLFRGALLYIWIKKIGVHRACLLSGFAFGVYHWFSYQAWGSIPQMVYIFLLTGTGGLLFAYSFALTKSMYLPVGLHLGWNLISVVIFSQGPLGEQLLISSGGSKLGGYWTLVFFIYQISLLPLVTYFYLRKKSVVDDNPE